MSQWGSIRRTYFLDYHFLAIGNCQSSSEKLPVGPIWVFVDISYVSLSHCGPEHLSLSPMLFFFPKNIFSVKLRYDLRLLLEVNRLWLRFPACMEEGLACPRSCREKESKTPKYLLLFDSLSIAALNCLFFLAKDIHWFKISPVFLYVFHFISFPSLLSCGLIIVIIIQDRQAMKKCWNMQEKHINIALFALANILKQINFYQGQHEGPQSLVHFDALNIKIFSLMAWNVTSSESWPACLPWETDDWKSYIEI